MRASDPGSGRSPVESQTLARFGSGDSLETADWDDVFDASVPILPKAPEVGDDLGAFVLKERLGEGGMGTVFRAEHRLIGREVAVKVLLPEFSQEREVVARFFREAQSVNLIHHPNIVDISDFVEGEDHPPYLIMELLEGQSLADLLRERGPLAPRQVIAIAMQICGAMAEVHARRIVHRDLKPDNIFVKEREDGTLRVKLLDFGIAKVLESDGQMIRTATGVPIGTPEYMSPEQIRGVDVGPRADIYAMGVILYEMLTGHVPFGSSQIGELLLKHLEEEPMAPTERRNLPEGAPIPKALEEAVLHCLAKDPDRRIQTMKQLEELLDWADESEMSSVVVIANPEALQRRRWPWLIGVGVAAAAAALMVGILDDGDDGTPGAATAPPPATPVTRPAPRTATAPRPRPALRRVRIETQPAGAAIFRRADGHYVEHTPATVTVPASGPLPLLVRMRGYDHHTVTLDGDSPEILRIVLKRLGPAPEVSRTSPPARRPAARPRSTSRPRPSARRPSPPRRAAEPSPPVRRRYSRDSTVNPFQ